MQIGNKVYSWVVGGTTASRGKSESTSTSKGIFSSGNSIKQVDSSVLASKSIKQPSFVTPPKGRASIVNWIRGTITRSTRRDDLQDAGALLSVSDFQAVAANSWAYSLGIGKSDRREMLRSLKQYENDRAHLTNDQKLQRLQTLFQYTETYIDVESKSIDGLKVSAAKNRKINKNLEAATLLKQGIIEEMELLLPCATKNEISAEIGPSGAMSQTVKIAYKNGDNGFFKSVGLEEMNSELAKSQGIPSASTLEANLHGRAVATYAVSKLLKLDGNLVPKTHFAVHQAKIGSFQEQAEGDHLFKTELREHSMIVSDERINQYFDALEKLSKCDNKPEEQDEAKRALQRSIDSLSYMHKSVSKIGDQICENGSPITRETAVQLIKENKIMTKEAGSLARALAETGEENDIQENDFELSDILLYESSLRKDGNQIYENGRPLTIERACELIRTKKIVKMERFVIEAKEIDLSKPYYQRQLNCAHWLDLLCGQLDRNGTNFIFGKENIGLIDNDLSFPPGWKDFENILGPIKALPRLIDRTIVDLFNELTSTSLEQKLQGCGLSQNEIKAAVSRLSLLKAHIQKIQAGKIEGGKVVDEWNQNTYEISIKNKDNYVQLCVGVFNGAKSNLEKNFEQIKTTFEDQ